MVRAAKAGGRQVLEVHAGAGHASEGDVTHHHQLLGLGRLAAEAELRRPLAFVHDPTVGERRDLAVLREHDRHTVVGGDRAGVLERPAHQPVVLQAGAVVGEHADTEFDEFTHRGELLAVAAEGHRRRGFDLAQRRGPERDDLVDDRGGVHAGIRVRHGDDGGETATGGAAAARLDTPASQ